MAAGPATLAYVRENRLAERAGALGSRMLDQLSSLARGLPCVGEVRGRGLMVAAELSRDDAPDLARRALLEQRLIVNATGPSTLRFLPPLIVSPAEIDDALSRLRALLS